MSPHTKRQALSDEWEEDGYFIATQTHPTVAPDE